MPFDLEIWLLEDAVITDGDPRRFQLKKRRTGLPTRRSAALSALEAIDEIHGEHPNEVAIPAGHDLDEIRSRLTKGEKNVRIGDWRFVCRRVQGKRSNKSNEEM